MTLIYIGLVILAIICVILGFAVAWLAKVQYSDYKFLIKYADRLKHDIVDKYVERLEERIEKLEETGNEKENN